jgi:hypothetical protein
MRPLFIRGHLQGQTVHQIMVDGGAGVNVMPLSTFERMEYHKDELMRTNMSLSAFTGKVTEVRGVLSTELMMGSNTLATTFFVVDVNKRYNLLLGQDWIHANGCVSSTLHQCLIQWIDDEVEVVSVEDSTCISTTEAHDTKVSDGVQDGEVACLSRRNLSEYDYISVSKDELVPISVKPGSITRLNHLNA